MLVFEDDGSITYKGSVVGHITTEGNETKVEINLTYSSNPEDAIAPVSWLAYGLRILEGPPPPIVLTVRTEEADIESRLDVPEFLIEKIIKRDGYIWAFHKADADPWPSPLHGHDYEKGLVVDVISGNIFDKVSRRQITTLNAKVLARLCDDVRGCKDLEDRAAAYLAPN
jgi:hypothetical protein